MTNKEYYGENKLDIMMIGDAAAVYYRPTEASMKLLKIVHEKSKIKICEKIGAWLNSDYNGEPPIASYDGFDLLDD